MPNRPPSPAFLTSRPHRSLRLNCRAISVPLGRLPSGRRLAFAHCQARRCNAGLPLSACAAAAGPSAHPATASSGFNGPGSFRLRAAIQAYPGRRLAADVIGRHAGPVNSDPTQPPLRTTAFETRFSDQGGGPPDLTISADRYHVDGIMIDATKPVPLDPVPSSTPTAPSVPGGAAGDGWTYRTQPYAYLDQENDAHQPRCPFSFTPRCGTGSSPRSKTPTSWRPRSARPCRTPRAGHRWSGRCCPIRDSLSAWRQVRHLNGRR